MEELTNPAEAPAEQTHAEPSPNAEMNGHVGEIDPNVTFAVTNDGKTEETSVRFHTPSLLERVAALPDTATVTITAPAQGVDRPARVLLSGTKEEATKKLTASIVRPELIVPEIRKFMRFLLDHSTMRAVGVHAVFVAADGTDSGFGFAETAPDCTIPQAISFVNCGDANINEFVTKAKLDIPGRAAAAGTVVTPTPEEVKSLG